MNQIVFWSILGIWICIVAIKYILESQHIPFPDIGVYLSFYGFMLFCSWLFYDPEIDLEDKLNPNIDIPEAIEYTPKEPSAPDITPSDNTQSYLTPSAPDISEKLK